MTDDTPVWIVVAITITGFFSLAAALLIPVYRFLKREEEISKDWVEKGVSDRGRVITNGANPEDLDGSDPT